MTKKKVIRHFRRWNGIFF